MTRTLPAIQVALIALGFAVGAPMVGALISAALVGAAFVANR